MINEDRVYSVFMRTAIPLYSSVGINKLAIDWTLKCYYDMILEDFSG